MSGICMNVAEYMGMAKYELVIENFGHIGYIKLALFASDERIEENMKKKSGYADTDFRDFRRDRLL